MGPMHLGIAAPAHPLGTPELNTSDFLIANRLFSSLVASILPKGMSARDAAALAHSTSLSRNSVSIKSILPWALWTTHLPSVLGLSSSLAVAHLKGGHCCFKIWRIG